MGIIKKSLTRDDILDIIGIIESKLSSESIILYMGYFLNNIDSCETASNNDQQLLQQLSSSYLNNSRNRTMSEASSVGSLFECIYIKFSTLPLVSQQQINAMMMIHI